MRIHGIIVLSLVLSTFNLHAESNPFEIILGFSPGVLFDGFQREIPNTSLSPQPNSYASMDLNFGLRYYFQEFLGLEVSSSFLGSTSAHSDLVQNSLHVFDYLSFSAGMVFRIPFHVFEKVLVIYAGGGANFSFIWYDQQFKDLLGSFVLYDIDPFFGAYCKMGLELYLSPHFFIGAAVQYVLLNGTIKVTNKQLDGHYIRIPVYLGISLY
jgi:hypothetical protein